MKLIVNKKAHFDYTVTRTYQAGIVLTGGEVKSVRKGSGSLTGSFVKLIGGEAFLINAQVTPYVFADNREYDPKRTRKLLLKHKELEQMAELLEQKGLTLVPLAFELVGRNIKVAVGVAKGKKQFEKRSELRQRDINRDIAREMKDKVRIV